MCGSFLLCTRMAETAEELNIAQPALEDDPEVEDGEIEEVDDEEGDEDEGSFEGEMFDPMHQLTQLLITEDGTPLVDVVEGINKGLQELTEVFKNQNRILFRISKLLDSGDDS